MNRSSQNITKVEMSGYLKKKRNKVGGWRKMWFVLQNQLLLSYNSKEEYDKKLVSFKDVLNLVPGTIVHPLADRGFTIETTTDTIYTFRCDDNKSCTDWITALVESLSIQRQYTKANNGLRIKTKLNVSDENIKQICPKRTICTSYSWDSICYQSPNRNFLVNKSPKIPIAQNTEKFLKRTGVEILNKITPKHLNIDHEVKDHSKKERPCNFRLHNIHTQLQQQQSVDVSRINRMFITPNLKQNQNRDQIQNSTCDITGRSRSIHKHSASDIGSATTMNISTFDLITKNTTGTNTSSTGSTSNCSGNNNETTTSTNYNPASTMTNNNLEKTCPMFSASASVPMPTAETTEGDDSSTKNNKTDNCVSNINNYFDNKHYLQDKKEVSIQRFYNTVINGNPTEIFDNKRKCMDNKSFLKNNNNSNEMVEKFDESNSLNNQIQNLTIQDSSDLMFDQHFFRHPYRKECFHDNNCTYDQNHQQQQKKLIQNNLNWKIYEHDQYHKDNQLNNIEHLCTDDIDKNDDKKHNIIEIDTNLDNENKLNIASNSYVNLNNRDMINLYSKISVSSENVNIINGQIEPIYAVVDLKNKYAHRNKLKQLKENKNDCVIPDNKRKQLRPIDNEKSSSSIEHKIEFEQEKKERPKSFHINKSDYEEVLNFSNDYLHKNDGGNENIYEPINLIDESDDHHNHRHHRNAIWKYFSRINIDTIFDMTRSRYKKK